MKHFKFRMLFKDDDVCRCGSLILKAHREFLFWRHPDDIHAAERCGGVPSEWRPWLTDPRIHGDEGPARVAYALRGEPTVQVHEGSDTGMWKPCFSYTVTRDGMPYCMWMCRMSEIDNPCDEEFMREISS